MAGPAPSAIEAPFPIGGLDRRYGYRNQPPYTTPDCLNVRPIDTLEQRARGGSRPGLGKAYATELGSGTPVRMMQTVELTVGAQKISSWVDDFVNQIDTGIWSAASWADGLPEHAGILGEYVVNPDVTVTTRAAVRAALGFDETQPYEIRIFVRPHNDGRYRCKYQLYGRLDDTTPDALEDGLVAELDLTGADGAYAGNLKAYLAGSLSNTYNFSTGDLGVDEPGWFVMRIVDNQVVCTWRGTQVLSQTLGTGEDAGLTGTRFGFGMVKNASWLFNLNYVDTFQIVHYELQDRLRRQFVASAGGVLYREGFEGQLEVVTSNAVLAADRQIMAVEHLQKLFIADWGDLKHSGSVSETPVPEFTSGTELTVVDVTGLGIDPDSDLIEIFDGTGTVVDGVYGIASAAGTEIVLASSCGATSGDTCSFRVEPGPKVYDPAANTLVLWAPTAGFIPLGCKIIERFRDALYLGGSARLPHIWYKSRNGNPFDWDIAGADPEDPIRPMAGQNTYAGAIGQALTGMVSTNDDEMLMACERSLWKMRGDPAAGGIIHNLSNEIGMFHPFGFAHTPDGATAILSHNGLYLISSVGGSRPVEFSEDVLPDEFQNLAYDPALSVAMAYDVDQRGFYVCVTPEEGLPKVDFWCDWATKSFWRDSHQDAHHPTSMAVNQLAGRDVVLLGGRDGYIRSYDRDRNLDDGSAIAAHVYIGPFLVSGTERHEGVLKHLYGILDEQSGDLDWEIHVGRTQEAVLDSATPFASGTWSAGFNPEESVQARGVAAALRLATSASNAAWAFEVAHMDLKQAGRVRA